MNKVLVGLAFVLFALPFTASAQNIPLCGGIPCPTPSIIPSPIVGTATVGTPIQVQFSGNPFISSDSISFSTTTNPTLGTLGPIANDTETIAVATYTPTTAGVDTFVFEADEYATTDPSTIINTATSTVTITVSAGSGPTPDTTAPVITVPATQYFATSTFPTSPTLTFATATDDTDPSPTITVSTTTFSAGTTTVTWTATDASGNSSATTSLIVITDTTPSPVSVSLSIYTSTSTVFSGPITVSACPETLGGATTTVNGFCAVDQASQTNSFPVTWQWFSFGAALTAVNGEGDWNNGPWYTTFLNRQPLAVALSAQSLAANDSLIVTDGPMPLEISVSTSSPTIGATTTVTVLGFNATNFDYEPVSGATIVGASTSTNANGTVDITATSTDPFTISANATGYIASDSVTVTAVQGATSTPVSGSNPASSGGGGGGGGISHGVFSVPRALDYLASAQHPDGSFDNDTLTDWAALTFAAQDANGSKAKLTAYEKSAAPSVSSITDYERHAMALEALGINPFNGTSVDYISPIVSGLGSLSCDVGTVNAQIFAIFPLLHAGYSTSDSVIQSAIACIVSTQASNGSWNDPDTTSAAIQALALVSSLPNATTASAKARDYLKTQQQMNGGFSNTPSTSWALQAIAALGQAEPSWAPIGFYPSDYLASMQQADGGVEPVSKDSFTRAWATEYAIPGVLGKTWNSLLNSFSHPSTGGGGGGSVTTSATTTSSATTTAATTTTAVATSTAPVATTTPTILPVIKTISTSGGTTTAPTTPVIRTVAKTPAAPTTATSTASTTSSVQVAAAASVAVPFDWLRLFYYLLGFLALCGLSWLIYTLVVKRD